MCQNCPLGLKAEDIQEVALGDTHSAKCVNALFLRVTGAGCYMWQPPVSIFFLALSCPQAPNAIMTHNATMTLAACRLQTVCTVCGNFPETFTWCVLFFFPLRSVEFRGFFFFALGVTVPEVSGFPQPLFTKGMFSHSGETL